MRQNLILLLLNPINNDVIENLKADLSSIFQNIIKEIHVIEDTQEIMTRYYNTKRMQHNASLILEDLIKIGIKEETFRILGISNEDLYSEKINLEYVFGVAYNPNGLEYRKICAAIISIKRLDQQYYDLPGDISVFRERILKECAHELGHTFGLHHCQNECVMQFSKKIGDTDRKPRNFCNECQKKILGTYKVE